MTNDEWDTLLNGLDTPAKLAIQFSNAILRIIAS